VRRIHPASLRPGQMADPTEPNHHVLSKTDGRRLPPWAPAIPMCGVLIPAFQTGVAEPTATADLTRRYHARVTAQPTEASAPDIHTTAGKIADLLHRYDEAVHAGSDRAVEKQHARGKKTARERVAMLLDEGSCVEL